MGVQMIKDKYINLHFHQVNDIQRSRRRYKAAMQVLKYSCAALFTTLWLWAMISLLYAAVPGHF